ncbi:FtsH protease activity modulator HflK [Glaesserella parasuis]|uniref:FtsH protease activity modulator HflK n=1 Tax=Glaesserella parasuis TaxID=738 RepID=UPI0003ABE396|nr:FtsH protease activity modulator HflK [Glaesserella parasuis]ATW46035.1 HflK protein [Glaesserella parasuis str. Nagasaki]EPZ98972.1 HflK protein [Glaesserella parasuis str. Nagasaki]EYE72154.1 protein HflK/membrane protease subunit, stomatin/prohibitin-like protein [Glaesserella parasuis str. Nagasaki]MCT8775089.1 FtsH protease activity modulator HflK [Glaesserella parasuis]MDE3954693.1 FtsH protease activity modulator HflK [Glaesserella parasuis]
MSWNESGNQQDPWGKPGQKKPEQEQPSGQEKGPNKQSNEPQPPDLEEVFNSLLKKMGGGRGNGSNQNNRPPVSAGKFLPVLLGLGLVVWGASGFYTVQEAERGVVTRFGKLHEIVLPGLNWKPTFIDNVTPVNIERVLELRTNGSMLTQDENMVLVEMTVQYRIEDPAKYLFSVTKPDDSLKQATDSALRYVIGHMTMDDILTTGRAIVREKTWNALRDIIKNYDMGLLITDVNFQYARPPEEVKAAFDDAIKAQEDEQRLIREAEAYARGQEPIARGQAQRILEQANAYKEQVVLNARGEVQRFTQLLPEYKAAPEVTRDRLYIQTMEKVMKNTPKLMVDSSNGNNLTVLPVDRLMAKSTTNEAVKTPSSQPVIQQQPQLAQPVSPAQLPAVEQSEPVRKGRF